ncbi:putative SP-containing protein [Vairimorpha necatrix]|uniref:SP-containing protein n=1 Tax=Vairimorpha necatrix TaxID=6039 RepID=A0AAX4J7L7_9MICR
MKLLFIFFISSSPLNKKLNINDLSDPFLKDENGPFLKDEISSDQNIYNTISRPADDSSSTNKELFDDIGDNKLPIKNPLSASENAQLTKDKLNEFNNSLNEILNLEQTVNSLTDKDMWKNLHDYIIKNWDKFFIDGHFSIQLQLRYVLCSYVIAFIPGQFAFCIPGFYTYLIPKKAYKVPILSDALLGVKKFFKFCKKTSRDKLFVTFYFGRANSLQEDLEFIKKIPEMIVNNPIGIIRELLSFSVKAEGYDPTK